MAKSKKPVVRFKNIPTEKELRIKKQESSTKKRNISPKVGLFSNIPGQEKKREENPLITPVISPQPVQDAERVEQVAVPAPKKSVEPTQLTDQTEDFPRISRVITEQPSFVGKLTNKWFLVGLVAGILLVAIGVIAGEIQSHIREKQQIEQQRTKIQQQITYWQKNIKKYPGYRDGYFQLAILEYQLGDIQASQDYLNKVETLDPNFQEAYKLEKVLQTK